MDKFDKYLLVVKKLKKRYTKDNVLFIGNAFEPSKYVRLENLAAKKILGL